MSTYKRFEDLPVWQAAADLYASCDDFLERAPPRLRPSVRDQLERAVLSVSNNIAEGFERGTTNELIAFLYIARGSAGEVRSMLTLLAARSWMKEFHSELSELISKAESCSRQLRAWAESLQNSDIAGPRHLNDASRTQWEKRQSVDVGQQAFATKQREIAAALPPEHPLRRQWEEKYGPLP